MCTITFLMLLLSRDHKLIILLSQAAAQIRPIIMVEIKDLIKAARFALRQSRPTFHNNPLSISISPFGHDPSMSFMFK